MFIFLIIGGTWLVHRKTNNNNNNNNNNTRVGQKTKAWTKPVDLNSKTIMINFFMNLL